MQESDRRKESVVLFPAWTAMRESTVYSVAANGCTVHVECFENVHIAQFAFAGPCEVVVAIRPSVGGPVNHNVIHSFSLKPETCGIVPAVDGGTLTFTMPQPGKVIVRVNEYERLLILADAAETTGIKLDDTRVLNVMEFATDTEGRKLQTDQIRRAVEATRKHGILYFPPGVYLSGAFDLKNHMTLYLAPGAVIRGSSNPADYAADKATGSHFIGIVGLQDVAVAGHGMIAGNGAVVRAAKADPALLLVRNSKDITVENAGLRDAAACALRICNSDRVTVRNVKVVNNCYVADADGFRLENCRNVLVENSFCMADDAAVVCTPQSAQAEDLVFRGNIVLARKAAFKAGPATQGDMSNVVFADNDAIECDCGMCIYCEEGAAISRVLFDRNRFHACRPGARQRLIDFHAWDRDGGGRIADVTIRDCEAAGPWPRPSTLFGESAECGIRGVRFENFTVGGTVRRNMKEADILLEVPPGGDLRAAGVRDVSFVPPDAGAWSAPRA